MVSSTPSARAGMPKFAFPALILANLILPLGPVLVRMADVGPVAAAFWRLTLALPFLLILALPRLRRTMPTIREWSALIWSGLFFAADLAAWHIGILYTKVTNATIFGNMSGLMLPIWGMVVLRQRPRAMQAIALTLATAGAAVMMGGSYELSPRYLHGDLLCLLAGATYTGYLLIVQRARVRLAALEDRVQEMTAQAHSVRAENGRLQQQVADVTAQQELARERCHTAEDALVAARGLNEQLVG